MFGGNSPGESSPDCVVHQAIVEWWEAIETGGDFGSTNWETLVSLRHSVTAALAASPPQLDYAGRQTALAMMLVTGRTLH